MLERTQLDRSVEGFDPDINSSIDNTCKFPKITSGERENELRV